MRIKSIIRETCSGDTVQYNLDVKTVSKQQLITNERKNVGSHNFGATQMIERIIGPL